MTIEKINFSYPKGTLQSVFDNEALTALELAAKTSKKVDECVEIVNGVEQTAIEATAIVDDMYVIQNQFVTDNSDTRAQLINDNQEYLDGLTTSKEQFETDINASKEQFETDINASKEQFETDINASKEQFETDMTNNVNTIIENSEQLINNNVTTKIEAMANDGTLSQAIDEQIFTEFHKAIEDIVINVKKFGAKGDGVTDDTTAINSAIEHIRLNTGSGTLYFPRGNYCISQTIIAPVEIKYINFLGDSYASSHIKAIADMENMLILSNDTGFHGRIFIKGLTFNGNNYSLNGINGEFLRYSTIEENAVIDLKENGYCLIIGNWCNRILNNQFNGSYKDILSQPNSNGIKIVGTVNNLIIQNNTITSCKHGIYGTAFNDIHILNNCFDVCKDFAIGFIHTGRNLSIQNNYFEACGHGEGLNVETANGIFEKFKGTIVLLGNYTVNFSYYFTNVNIKCNFFASCGIESIITASHLSLANISQNSIMRNTNYTHFVNIVWTGCSAYFAKRIYIEIPEEQNGQFSIPVGLNADDAKQAYSNMVIDYPRIISVNSINVAGWQLNNIDDFDGTWEVTDNGKINGLFPIKHIKATSNIKTLILDLSLPENSSLAGSYLRTNVISKGVGTDNSLQIRIYINNVELLNMYKLSTEFMNVAKNNVFYIPKDATSLKITLKPLYNSSDIEYTKFIISNANIDLNNLIFDTRLEPIPEEPIP